ncbi:MAG: hypothetical protein ACREX6_11425, partial [Casimicrobiaceae bacterium]
AYGDSRRAEREAAYAKNPDQPVVRREGAPAPGGGTVAGHHAGGHSPRKARVVPALLSKRHAPEIEKV